MAFITRVPKEICWLLSPVATDIRIITSGSWKTFCVMLDTVISDALTVPNKKASTEVPINGTAGEPMASACSVLRARSRRNR